MEFQGFKWDTANLAKCKKTRRFDCRYRGFVSPRIDDPA
jgi:hypothetical protein